jgi:predicted PurR-regulated permease PerM
MSQTDGKPSEQDADDFLAKVGSSPTHISDPKLAYEARRALVWVGVVGLALLVVYMAHSLLVVFAGMVFAAMIDGGARLLERVLPIGRGWRIALVLSGGIAFLTGTVFYAGATITSEAAELPALIEAQASEWLAWGRANGLNIDMGSLQSFSSQFASGVGTVTRALTGLLGGITSVVLIAILGIYIAMEPRLYERGVAWILPEEQREDFYVTISLMARALRHLLAGRLFGMVVEGIFTWLMLSLYGVPMAALLGLLTGLLAFIPNVGAVLSGVLMVLVGFSGGTDMGLYTIFVYLTVQTIDGYVLSPLIAKKTVDLAPALVLACQLIMGVMFGILGLALADPFVAMIKVALERRSAKYDATHPAKGKA